MARKEKAGSDGSGIPAWMITFSDLMTLLLTFFVLLVSMAVVDQQRALSALGSVSTTFGMRPHVFRPLSTTKTNEPGTETGPMTGKDLSPLKESLWEDSEKDLRFMENRFVQILSINADVLFEPGKPLLSDRGKALLRRIVPSLLHVEYPLLVAGHTANRRDEEEDNYTVNLSRETVDSTWFLSLARAQGVYQYLVQNGLPGNRLTMEAFGQHRPRYSDRTPEGRRLNRRVDIVLDKRNAPEVAALERQKQATPRRPGRYLFRNFQFDLDAAPNPGVRTGEN